MITSFLFLFYEAVNEKKKTFITVPEHFQVVLEYSFHNVIKCKGTLVQYKNARQLNIDHQLLHVLSHLATVEFVNLSV